MATPALDWPELRDYREYMIRHLDDTAQVRGYEQAGATVVKGAARLAGPGCAEAGGELLEANHIVIATGSCRCARRSMAWARYRCGPTERLAPWPTSRPGAADRRQRGRGRGHHRPAGARAGRPRGPRVGELARDALPAEGVTICTGRTAARAEQAGDGAVITLGDGTKAETDVVILGVGRRPATAGLGPETRHNHTGRARRHSRR